MFITNIIYNWIRSRQNGKVGRKCTPTPTHKHGRCIELVNGLPFWTKLSKLTRIIEFHQQPIFSNSKRYGTQYRAQILNNKHFLVSDSMTEKIQHTPSRTQHTQHWLLQKRWYEIFFPWNTIPFEWQYKKKEKSDEDNFNKNIRLVKGDWRKYQYCCFFEVF